MKQVIALIIISITMIGSATETYAQSEEWTQARSIFQAYGKSASLSFNAIIKMYPVGQPGKILDQVNATYVMQSPSYYCKIGAVEIINNNEGSFVVDHDDKIVLVGKKRIIKGGKGQPDEAYSLESLFFHMRFDSVKLEVSTKGSLRQLDVTRMSDPRVIRYQLIYNPSTFLISQLIMEIKPEDTSYGKGNFLVEINYSKYQKDPKPNDTFSGNKFVSINGKNVALKPAYTSYQLVNQL